MVELHRTPAINIAIHSNTKALQPNSETQNIKMFFFFQGGEEEEEVEGVQVDGFQEFQTDVTGNRGKNNSKHFLLSDNTIQSEKVAFVDEDVFVRDD